MLLFVGGIIGFFSWRVMKSIRPHEIEAVALNPKEKETFDNKVATLQRGKGGGTSTLSPKQSAGPVTFSSREISSLLSNLDFGNHHFQVRFAPDRILVLANLPVPKELPGLKGDEAEGFSNLISTLPLGQQIPLSAEVRIDLRNGRPFLQLISADMMNLPLSTFFGPKWQAGQEIDILSKFGNRTPIVETIFGHLQQLKYDEKGLHLTPR